MVRILTLLLLFVSSVSAQTLYCGQDTGLSAKVTLSNMCTYSEQIDHANWTKTRLAAAANSITAPDGTLTAEMLTSDATAASTHATSCTAITVTASSVYRMSAYVKKGTYSYYKLQAISPNTASLGVNLSTGTINSVGSSVISYSILSVGNGWYRVAMTYAATATPDYIVHYITDSAYTNSWSPAGTETIYVWGSSLQLASAPADYIATTSAAATLGPLCAAGTTQSPTDPSKCMALGDEKARKW